MKDELVGGSGLQLHLRWVESSGHQNPQWFKPVFHSLRSRHLSSEERSLLWQTMHSDGRFGYCIRLEARVNDGADVDCPFCGPIESTPKTTQARLWSMRMGGAQDCCSHLPTTRRWTPRRSEHNCRHSGPGQKAPCSAVPRAATHPVGATGCHKA